MEFGTLEGSSAGRGRPRLDADAATRRRTVAARGDLVVETLPPEIAIVPTGMIRLREAPPLAA
jgi:hypothetical protein